MLIAVEGCCHGELDAIYAAIQETERREGVKVDLLLCCGDFESMRNEADLACMACPPKYRHMMNFYQYYSGAKRAPVLTIFIGGNHEGTNYLWELCHGGWVAENIYYLGHAGVINVGGLRLAGLSGIFNGAHYQQGHFERPPYTEDTMRSAYHIRELDVFRLSLLRQPIDIFLSHDWPAGIAHHGDKQRLFRLKPFLRSEVENGSLGSPPARQLLDTLRPRYWFAAHLHVKFPAVVQHPPAAPSAAAEAAATTAEQPAGGAAVTRFLALDKCLPRRDYLQLVDLPEAAGPVELRYDAEWLAILQRTDSLTHLDRQRRPMPMERRDEWRPSAEALERLASEDLRVPLDVPHTAPAYDPGRPWTQHEIRANLIPRQNPQTAYLCQLAGIRDPTALLMSSEPAAPTAAAPAANPDEINLDDILDDPTDAQPAATSNGAPPPPATNNPDEIALDD